MDNDPERLPESSLPGSYVEVLASSTSKSSAICRRFDKLTLACILHQQEKLHGFEKLIDYTGPEVKPRTVTPSGAPTMDNIQEAVTKYHETLFYYSHALKFGRPGNRTSEAIQSWLDERGGEERSKFSLRDDSGHYKDDLISLYTPVEEDRLSRFITSSYLRVFFLDRSDPKLTGSIGYLNEDSLRKFVTFLGALIAIVFLIAAMWIVWVVKSIPAKLGVVTGFVVGFTFWAMFFTNAQRKEVYAAVAAYAAVLVVFAAEKK